MKTLIAIGGGNFQRQETAIIDEYMLQRCGKDKPKLLFFPTALKDDQGYAKRFKQHYRALGCVVEAIRLFHTKLTKAEIREKMLHVDILYLGAGNVEILKKAFLDWELDVVLQEAYQKGTILCGMSAGANIVFDYSYCDIKDDGSEFRFIEGFHIVEGVFCPHAQRKERQAFHELAKAYDKVRIPCADKEAYILEDYTGFYKK